MLNFISWLDNFLNGTTMYRLVLYYLTALWVIALVLSFFGVLPYSPISLIISLIILFTISFITNKSFAYFLKIPANVESIYISVFILALIMPPAATYEQYFILAQCGVFAMASKYIIAPFHRHIFNPAALTAVLTTLLFGQPATWWVGAFVMLPFVVLGGAVIIRKIKRVDLAVSFLAAAVLTAAIFGYFRGENIFDVLGTALLYSPLFFFMSIMITEPQTTPPTRVSRIFYGALVGLFFSTPVSLGPLYFTPEIALLCGNIFSYLISFKKRLTLRLKEKRSLAPDAVEYIFQTNTPIDFKPGQYLEWTLGHEDVDIRGNRRYFTIASSPTEKELRLGIRFYENGSSFKKSLAKMNKGDVIFASQLCGDFVLPRNKEKKLVFIAGGIGVTPFRSMVKYLLDKNEKRDIVLLYSNKQKIDIAYKDIFDDASKELGVKIVHTLTDPRDMEIGWTGRRGFIDSKMITEEVKDWKERTFYISGPPSMVSSTKKVIRNLGLRRSQIKTDFFPGYV